MQRLLFEFGQKQAIVELKGRSGDRRSNVEVFEHFNMVKIVTIHIFVSSFAQASRLNFF